MTEVPVEIHSTLYSTVNCPECDKRIEEFTAAILENGSPTATANISKSAEDISPEDMERFQTILFVVNRVIPPIIIIVGVIGNALSFLVFRKPKYAKQSTCVYMRALTFFDTFSLLIFGFQRYLFNCFQEYFWQNGDIFCKEFVFVAFLSMTYSHWTVVLMTVDRYLAVRFPLKSAFWCTTKRAKRCIGVMAVVFAIFHLQQFWRVADPGANVLKFQCPFDVKWVAKSYEMIFQHIFTYLVFYAPLFSLLCLNALIIYNVTKRRIHKRKLGLDNGRCDSVRRFRRGQDRQITIMLLLVTWVFTIAVTPFTLDHFFWDVARPDLEKEPKFRVLRHVLYEIAVTCVTINPAINFYLYSLGCAKFREDLKTIIRWPFCEQRRQSDIQPSSQSRGVESSFSSGETAETDSINTRV